MARGGGKTRGSKKSSRTFNSHKNQHKRSSKKPNRYLMVKRQIERNKESEDILKRQQLGEYYLQHDKEMKNNKQSCCS